MTGTYNRLDEFLNNPGVEKLLDDVAKLGLEAFGGSVKRVEGEDIEALERSQDPVAWALKQEFPGESSGFASAGSLVGRFEERIRQSNEPFITKDSGERVEFDSGMVRDVGTGKPRYDLIPLLPLRRLADLYARGAEKYGDCNWQLANSPEEMQRFKASCLRHLFQGFDGQDDEDHLIAAVWNLFAIVYLQDKLNFMGLL